MTSKSSTLLYLRLYKKKIIYPNQIICLGEMAQMIVDEPYFSRLQCIVIFDSTQCEGSHHLIGMMDIITKIKQLFPQLQVEYFGEPHILLEMSHSTQKPRWIWIVTVWLVLFVGSGLAIMNFHEDVSMREVHQRINELLTGKRDETPRWIQVPYSFGIGMGMVIFFNHIFKKKINEEPSPLEVEMFSYQESIHQYIVTEEYASRQQEKDKA